MNEQELELHPRFFPSCSRATQLVGGEDRWEGGHVATDVRAMCKVLALGLPMNTKGLVELIMLHTNTDTEMCHMSTSGQGNRARGVPQGGARGGASGGGVE
jgi:hypothetical protein